MDTVYEADILSRYKVPRHRLTVHDYYRLAEAGSLEIVALPGVTIAAALLFH